MLEEDISKSKGEMDEQFMEEYMDAASVDDFETFAENWGLSVDEAHKIALEMPQLDGFVPESVTKSESDEVTMDENTVIDKATVTAANDAYENTGKLDFNPEMDPEREAILNGMVGSTGKLNAAKGMLSKAGNKIFGSKALKANQKAKRGTEGPVVTGASRTLKDSNLRPSVSNKTADRYKSMSDKVKKDNATKVGTTVAAGTAIGLSGNRNSDGDFVSSLNENTPREKVDLQQPQGIEQPEEKPETAPEVKSGNQNGYHKLEGQNFWTVDNEDPYWDTHEIGTGDMDGSAAKSAPAKELDWSNWF